MFNAYRGVRPFMAIGAPEAAHGSDKPTVTRAAVPAPCAFCTVCRLWSAAQYLCARIGDRHIATTALWLC